MNGLAFILLALLILSAIAWWMIALHRQELTRLDDRLARQSAGGAPVRRTAAAATPMLMPAFLAPLLARAQIELTARPVGLVAGVNLLTAVAALLAAGPAAALGVLLLPALLGLLYARARARRRVEALIEALPHYIDAVRQMNMVGNSLAQALERSLADAPPIVRSYMAPVARRLELGAPAGEAIQMLADRLGIAEISMLAAAIRTNLRYGGSINTVLSNLSGILRARIRVKRELDAATAQARVSARVLIAMPVVALGLMVLMNPAYLDFFTGDHRGRRLAVIAVGFQGLGIVAMNRMMRLSF
ncbi:tight adherence protein B [Sphingobium jiangsuense]|uniref:Tight adherence protein B n=2 Tax=Sphingobium jiangsuense TaxID=870476 RepID=A0A7W6FQU2_9SPHN|nr:type II secretion system F family protein [Sphingobium jiangsuense]MBB3927027.1 tight adherence protein B [Sphingobium jiangsuense]